MNNPFSWKSAAVALGLVTLWAIPARAQESVLRVTVPFTFTAGNRVLPAGDYRVMVDPEHMFTLITGTSATAPCMIRLVPGVSYRTAGSTNTGMLRFQKYGSRYTLTGIWKAGSVEGNAVIATPPPKELANSTPAVTVRSH